MRNDAKIRLFYVRNSTCMSFFISFEAVHFCCKNGIPLKRSRVFSSIIGRFADFNNGILLYGFSVQQTAIVIIIDLVIIIFYFISMLPLSMHSSESPHRRILAAVFCFVIVENYYYFSTVRA